MARCILAVSLFAALLISVPAAPCARDAQAGSQTAHAEGEWKDGKPDGFWIFFAETGEELVRARYLSGALNGKFRLLWPSGETRAETKFKRGKLAGEMNFFTQEGKRFEPWCGDYELSVTRWPGGAPRARGLLLDGAPHGIWEYVWPNGAPLLTAYFDRGEPVGKWTFFHLDGTPDEGFFGEAWSVGIVADSLTEQPWKLFFEPLLDAPKGPQPFVRLLEPSSPVAPAAGDLAALAPELFNALDVEPLFCDGSGDSGIEVPDNLTFRDFPKLIATLLKLDVKGASDELAALFEGPVRKILIDTPLVAKDASPADLHLAIARLLAMWALVGDDPTFWELHLTVSHVHTLRAQLRPLPKEALGVASGGPAPAYAGRFHISKKKLRELGEPWRASMDAGLEFLVGMQAEDGHWEGSTPSEVGCTALALAALAGDGNTIYEGPYSDAVRRGVKWLYGHQEKMTGQIKSSGALTAGSYGELIAASALAELYGMAPSLVQRMPLEKALAFVASSRAKSSGWAYLGTSGISCDTSLTGWAVLALAGGLEAGVPDADDTLHAALSGGLDFIESMLEPTTGRIGYNAPGSFSARIVGMNDQFPADAGETLTAEGMYALIRGRAALAGREADSSPDSWAKQVELLQRKVPMWGDDGFTTVMYYWFFGSQALHLVGGLPWKRWWPALERTAFDAQDEGTGAWAPIGPWGMLGGPSYSTAIMLLALEAPIR